MNIPAIEQIADADASSGTDSGFDIWIDKLYAGN
jgi:hypothetical protein